MATETRSNKQLLADQEAWEAGRQGRENQLRELDIALDALGPKVQKARELLIDTKAQVSILEDTKRQLDGEVSSTRAIRVATAQNLAKVQSDLFTLEEILGRKQAEIDADMETYGRRKRGEYDLVLADVRSLITEARQELASVQAQQTDAQNLLDVTRQNRVAERTAAEAEVAALTGEIRRLMDQKPIIEAEIAVVDTQLRRASVERDGAIADRDKAKIEHDNFLKYERQARDILDTKDRELQQKADNISTGERRLKASRSFLAELN